MYTRAALVLLLVGCSGPSRPAATPRPASSGGLSTPAPMAGVSDDDAPAAKTSPTDRPMVGACARVRDERKKRPKLDRPPRLAACAGSVTNDDVAAPWVAGTDCATPLNRQIAPSKHPGLRRALGVEDLASATQCETDALYHASRSLQEALQACFEAAGAGVLLRAEVVEFFAYVGVDGDGKIAGVDLVGASPDDQQVARCLSDRVVGTPLPSRPIEEAVARIAVDGRLEEVQPRRLAPRLEGTCWEAALEDGQATAAAVKVMVPAVEEIVTPGPCAAMWLFRAHRLK